MIVAGPPPLALRWELARKVLHMLWAVVPVAYASGVGRPVILIGLTAACVTALIIEIARAKSARVGAIFHRTTGAMLREHEYHRWSGATWLLLSFVVVTAVFNAPTAITAMWAVAMGDASAAVVGRLLGRRRLGTGLKTIEGSIACAVVTTIGALVLARLPAGLGVAAGISAALSEWPARPLDDNVRIGLGTAAGILLCRMAFS